MGQKLRTTVSDLAEELRRRGLREAALRVEPFRHIGAVPADSDVLVSVLADLIEGEGTQSGLSYPPSQGFPP